MGKDRGYRGPTKTALLRPVFEILKDLGQADGRTIRDEIVRRMSIPQETAKQYTNKGSVTELEYQAKWARTYLKNYGVIEALGKGVWTLTQAGNDLAELDPKDVNRANGKQKSDRLKQRSENSNLFAEYKAEKDEFIEDVYVEEPVIPAADVIANDKNLAQPVQLIDGTRVTVTISRDNFIRLQSLAVPLVDTMDTILARLLDQEERG